VTVTVVDHPIAAQRLATLRDINTPQAQFRHALDELSFFLFYEATRDLATEDFEVVTPLEKTIGRRVSRTSMPIVVPILRAGLGMLDAANRLLPEAPVGFLGMARDHDTYKPDPYMNTIPKQLNGQPALVLDPMLATGGSLTYACDTLVNSGVGHMTIVCVLASPEGVARIEGLGYDLRIVTASVDSHLNERAYIVPGLGDAGDRQFGTP
jgi:uracil phosphoribosyltransferase